MAVPGNEAIERKDILRIWVSGNLVNHLTVRAKISIVAPPLDRGRKRSLALAVIFPGGQLAHQRRCGPDRVFLWIQPPLHLAPAHRHGNRRSGPPARRERRHRCGHAVVAQIVEENAAMAFLLRHVDQVAVRRVRGHALANVAGECFGDRPTDVLGRRRRHHMQALAARRLAEAYKAQSVQTVADLTSPGDHLLKWHVRCRIQVEHQPPRLLGRERLAISWMQFQSTDLRRRHQGFDPVELQVGLAITPNRHLGDQRGLALAGVTLEELFFALDRRA